MSRVDDLTCLGCGWSCLSKSVDIPSPMVERGEGTAPILLYRRPRPGENEKCRQLLP